MTLWTVSPFCNVSGSAEIDADLLQLTIGLVNNSDPRIRSGPAPYNVTIRYSSSYGFDMTSYDKLVPTISLFDGMQFQEDTTCEIIEFTNSTATFTCEDAGNICAAEHEGMNMTYVDSSKATASLTGGVKVIPGTRSPSSAPTSQPTVQPSSVPTTQPTGQPSSTPTQPPSISARPTTPSSQPSGEPSSRPSGQPSGQPSLRPSGQPTSVPTATMSPTSQPSGQPSGQPTSQPTVVAVEAEENPDRGFKENLVYIFGGAAALGIIVWYIIICMRQRRREAKRALYLADSDFKKPNHRIHFFE
jgi:hypothetical protein